MLPYAHTKLQARKIRLAYFRSVLSQDIAWFDSNATGAVGNRLNEDITKIQEAISDKLGPLTLFSPSFHHLGSLIQFAAMFFTGMFLH